MEMDTSIFSKSIEKVEECPDISRQDKEEDEGRTTDIRQYCVVRPKPINFQGCE